MKNSRCNIESFFQNPNLNWKMNTCFYITNIKILANNISEIFIFACKRIEVFLKPTFLQFEKSHFDMNEGQFQNAIIIVGSQIFKDITSKIDLMTSVKIINMKMTDEIWIDVFVFPTKL